MYTNGNRYPSVSNMKRKPENGSSEDIGGPTPPKQFSYYTATSTSSDESVAKQYSYSEGMEQYMAYSNSSSDSALQYASAAHYKPSLCPPPPPPPPAPYDYGDTNQYGYKQPENLASKASLPYASGPVQHPKVRHKLGGPAPGVGHGQGPHDMVGPPRGWVPRGRMPMRGGGFPVNQWRMGPPGMGPHGPGPQHPHVPPRGFFHGRGRGGPPGPHSYNHYNNYQSNQYGGWNQAYSSGHHSGHHQKNHQTKNRKTKDSSKVDGSQDKDGSGSESAVSKQSKRKNVQAPPFPSRPWNREDAEKALKVEVETTRALRNQSLIIRFPDPELSRDIVKKYHPGIQNVHFQVPSGPRYCFVQLAPNVNAEKTIKSLESIKFGTGRLTVEKKSTKQDEEISPESIDPYTLYIGNLPTNVNISTVKEKFPHAVRVDVGFAQRMRFTRYAFLRFNSVDEAIKAYKENHSLVLDSRSTIVRFRRQKGQIDLPGETKTQQPNKVNRTTDSKKDGETDEKVKTDVKKEAEDVKEEDEEDEDDTEEDDEEEEDDSSCSFHAGDDDDDDDDDDEEGRKPIQDDDDDDEDDSVPTAIGGAAAAPVVGAGALVAPPEPDIDPPIVDDDEDDDDPENLFRDLDAQLGDFDDGFPFNFN